MSAASTSDVHQLAVADIALDQPDRPARHAPLEVFRPAAHHVVERDDLDAALVAQQVDDMRADKAGAAGDQNALSLQISQALSYCRMPRFGSGPTCLIERDACQLDDFATCSGCSSG